MEYKKLNEETMEQYLDYLKSAMKEEPEEMLTEEIDENAIGDWETNAIEKGKKFIK